MNNTSQSADKIQRTKMKIIEEHKTSQIYKKKWNDENSKYDWFNEICSDGLLSISSLYHEYIETVNHMPILLKSILNNYRFI